MLAFKRHLHELTEQALTRALEEVLEQFVVGTMCKHYELVATIDAAAADAIADIADRLA